MEPKLTNYERHGLRRFDIFDDMIVFLMLAPPSEFRCYRRRTDVSKALSLAPRMQVYTNKDHLLDEAHGGASDGEDGRGPKLVFFDLKVARRSMPRGRLPSSCTCFALEHVRHGFACCFA